MQQMMKSFYSTNDGYLRRERLLPIAIALVAVVILPYLHLGVIYSYWASQKNPVDKDKCKCECWDTIFKGSYEMKVAGYKHMYFNITSNTFKIWAFTITAAIAFYETVCYLVGLCVKQQIRLSMLVLFVSVLYPHYYTWWSYFNYLNDEFYKQWNHQTFFSITELISTMIVLHLANRKQELTPRMMLIVIDIAVLHILAAGGDQFVRNVLFGEGEWHQYVRDIGFMMPDLINIVIPALEWANWCRKKGYKVWESVRLYEIILSVVSVLGLWGLCNIL